MELAPNSPRDHGSAKMIVIVLVILVISVLHSEIALLACDLELEVFALEAFKLVVFGEMMNSHVAHGVHRLVFGDKL